MLDYIDIFMEVPLLDYKRLSFDCVGENSVSFRECMQATRERPRVHFQGTDIICNSNMRVAEARHFCKLVEAGNNLVRAAMGQLNLSARGYYQVLKLACTIADLLGNDSIQSIHLAKAFQY